MRRMARPWPVAVTVEGLNIGRFVRYAGEANIRLNGMRRRSPRKVTALVQEDQLPILQDVTLRGGWKLTVGTRRGLGGLVDWLKMRWLLAGAVCMAVIALWISSQVVWRVEIENGGTYAADIRSAVEELGIAPPMLRRQVDIGALRNALEWRYPRIAWIECGWRGASLVIRPVEGVLPREEGESDGSADVVAVRDGIIHHIVTVAGTPVKAVGDIVRAGEIIIRGEERTSEGAVKPVAARGSVTARVWEGASVRISAAERVTNYTGNEQNVWTLRTPWFDLWPMESCQYKQYDTAVSETPVCGIFIPMTLHIERRLEAEISTTMRDQAELEAEASAAAMRAW